MKLVVTIPALNEEESVGDVVRSIPRKLEGFDEVAVLLVDDGSTDNTVEEARKAGCDRVLSFRRNQGLATVFKWALAEALRMDADVIVNIDSDGQYESSEMPRLLQPILSGEADFVLGSRFAGTIEEMPRSKRIGNRFGTWVTGKLARMPITDAQTGYRALTRHAALMLNILSRHTYTQETIIQAGYKRLKVVEVPITFKRRSSGSSRLVISFFHYANRAAITVGRMFISRHALTLMTSAGVLSILFGLGFGGRVLFHYFSTGQVSPFLPSAVLAGFGVVFGVQLIALGMISSMVADNRDLVEDALYTLKDRHSAREA